MTYIMLYGFAEMVLFGLGVLFGWVVWHHEGIHYNRQDDIIDRQYTLIDKQAQLLKKQREQINRMKKEIKQ